MLNIENELHRIQTNELGEEVRQAVADAVEKVASVMDIDVSSELNIIRNGRYGIDIRQAIYHALSKTSKVYDQLMEYLAKLQNGDPFAVSDVTAISAGGVSEDICAIAEEEA